MIGLSGTHGSGKTTLAEAFGRKSHVPVVLTSASGVYHSLGLDPAADYPVEVRLGAQAAILHAFTRQYSHAQDKNPVFIADRTPLDLISYMLADIQRATVLENPGAQAMVMQYIEDCYGVLNRFFSAVLIVQPGIPLQPGREGKAGACPAFMAHQNALLKGLLNDDRVKTRGYLMPTTVLDLDDRVKCVENAYLNAFRRQTEQVEVHKASGGMLH